MEVTLKNCNNIDNGTINISPGKLNIKFGINGTGKSTITKAIKYSIEESDDLNSLMPFKLVGTDTTLKPEVEIPDSIKSVSIFNEEYLDQFLYKEDELISNSYEIFIKTPEYQIFTDQISMLLSEIKKVFSDNHALEQIINDFQSLSDSFKTTKTGLSKSSSLFKGLIDGNQIQHVPDTLKGYSKLIKNKNCVKWLDWQIKGEEYLDISDDCPYCTSPTTEKKETIKTVSQVYNKTVIKNFNIILDAIENLGNYFSQSAKETLTQITEKQSSLEKEEEDYIVEVKNQIDNLLQKLKTLKNISFLSFKEGDDIEEKLKGFIIKIELYDRFKSDMTESIVDTLNSSLNTVLDKVGLLKGQIIQQQNLVKKLIEKHQIKINSYLENAGYKYKVILSDDDASNYKLLLIHNDSDTAVHGGSQHLSFGEKNAFALVLFMYEALSKKSDLIILDDPISSFDKSKKYAIMHMLFRGDSSECLKSKNVIMLTHDLDPIIDSVKVLKEFSNIVDAKFITTTAGSLHEKDIKRQSLLTFTQICKKAIASEAENIIKLIYLRRHYEILDDLGDEYEVLSNLFHKREISEMKDTRKEIGNDKLEESAYESGIAEIKINIPDFDYSNTLSLLSDTVNLIALFESAQNNYEKMNIFRLIFDNQINEISSVLRKFINESYHIENELICQLDPNEYDLVPSFIIEECTKYIETIKN